MSNINIKICEVISVDDIYESGRIKVRLYPEDSRKPLEEIPYCYPANPKMFNVMPKVGEAVIIFLTAASDGTSNRFYMGPVISQLSKMEYDGFYSGALSNFDDSLIKPNVSHKLVSEATGCFGDKNDVAIYGRKGSDIILKDNDIRIRAGAKIQSNNKIGVEFNRLNPAYLKLKYSEEPNIIESYNVDTNEFTVTKKYNSTATLVADEINLISNQSSLYFNTTDNEDMISDTEIDKIIQQAHVLPYGDVLVEFLKQFLWEFRNHAHPYPGMTTILYPEHEIIYNYDFDKMLSKNIRIN